MEAEGVAGLEVSALQRLPERAGFAPSGDRVSVLPRVQLTEGSGAGPVRGTLLEF
jgi:hypothetical protein